MTDAQTPTRLPSLRFIQTIPGGGWRDGAWMSPKHFAVAGDEGVWAYDVSTFDPRRGPVGRSGDVRAMAFAPSTRTLVLADESGQVHSNELGSGRAGFHFDASACGALRQVAVDPTGRHVAAAGEAGVLVYDLTTRNTWLLDRHRRAAAWLGDGVLAAAGGVGVEVWFWDTRGKVMSIAGDASQVAALDFLHNPQIVVVAASNGEVSLWSITGDTPQQVGAVHEPGGVAALAVAPDGEMLATGSPGGALRLWRGTAEPPATQVDGTVLALRFSPDGTQLAAVTSRGISLFAVEN